jgi:hypothetical protein
MQSKALFCTVKQRTINIFYSSDVLVSEVCCSAVFTDQLDVILVVVDERKVSTYYTKDPLLVQTSVQVFNDHYVI